MPSQTGLHRKLHSIYETWSLGHMRQDAGARSSSLGVRLGSCMHRVPKGQAHAWQCMHACIAVLWMQVAQGFTLAATVLVSSSARLP